MYSRYLDRKLKAMLLEEARKQGLKPSTLAERLGEELGTRVPADWSRIERLVVDSDEIDARELAMVLVDLGVNVPEDKWIQIVSAYQLRAPRRPGPMRS